MPWKNKEAQKEYAHKYYLAHKDDMYSYANNPKRREAVKRFRQKNRLKVNAYERKRHNPEKAKIQWDRNKEKHNAIGRSETELLSEKYIIKQLKKEGFTIEEIRQYPELIDTKRQIIKTKRLWNKSRTSNNSVTASAKTIRK